MEVINMIILLGVVLTFLVAIGIAVDLNSDKQQEEFMHERYWGL